MVSSLLLELFTGDKAYRWAGCGPSRLPLYRPPRTLVHVDFQRPHSIVVLNQHTFRKPTTTTVRSSISIYVMASTEEKPVDKRDVLDILDAEGKEFEKVGHV